MVASWRGLGVVAASATALPGAGLAQQSGLSPPAEWQLEQSKEYCRLSRDFGSGDQRTTFNLNSYGPSGSYRVTLTSASIPRNAGKARVRQVSFGDGEAQTIISIDNRVGERATTGFHLTGGHPSVRYYRQWDRPGAGEDPRPEAVWPDDFSTFSMEGADMERLTLDLSGIDAQLGELKQCQMRLAESWGFDQKALESVATEAKLVDSSDIVNAMRMPSALVMNHVSVAAQLRFTIDEEGRATDCVVQSPVLNARNQRDLCRPFMGDKHFEPARNAAGATIPSLALFIYTYFIFN